MTQILLHSVFKANWTLYFRIINRLVFGKRFKVSLKGNFRALKFIYMDSWISGKLQYLLQTKVEKKILVKIYKLRRCLSNYWRSRIAFVELLNYFKHFFKKRNLLVLLFVRIAGLVHWFRGKFDFKCGCRFWWTMRIWDKCWVKNISAKFLICKRYRRNFIGKRRPCRIATGRFSVEKMALFSVSTVLVCLMSACTLYVSMVLVWLANSYGTCKHRYLFRIVVHDLCWFRIRIFSSSLPFFRCPLFPFPSSFPPIPSPFSLLSTFLFPTTLS